MSNSRGSEETKKTFYVSLINTDDKEEKVRKNKKPKTNHSDGSKDQPFASMKQALSACKHYGDRVIVLQCAPNCVRKPCADEECRKTICTTHGDGTGVYAEFEGGISFSIYKCKACQKIEACTDHDYEMGKCDVCDNRMTAEVSLGMYDAEECGSCFLCDGCAKQCTRIFDPEDPEESYEADDCPESLEEDGKMCGFVCCPDCLESHKCGDDPTEYC